MSAASASFKTSRTPAKPAAFSLTPARGGLLQRKCACGGAASTDDKCDECRQKETGVQRLAAAPAPSNVAPPIVHDVLRSPGQPLDQATRASLEPRFGHDFSRVRVHADARAAESARAVAAHAFTVGSDIVFAAGRYAPGTESGRRLLAHELAHVVQQRSTTTDGPLNIGADADACERQAEAMAADAGIPPALAVRDNPARHMTDARPGVSQSLVQRANDSTDGPPPDTAATSPDVAPAVSDGTSATSAAAPGTPAPGAPDSSAAAAPPAGAESAGCEPPSPAPDNPGDVIFFENDVSTLDDPQKQRVHDFMNRWNSDGTRAPVRIDGYASKPGAESYNATLSCARARAVAAEMANPAATDANNLPIVGIPDSLIRKVGQGETDRFGPEPDNRRVAIFAQLESNQPKDDEKPNTAPQAPKNCGPGTEDPFCLGLPALGDKCTPFPTLEQGLAAWNELKVEVPLGAAAFTTCGEVKAVWDTYFAATSTPFAFSNPSSCVVAAAKADTEASSFANRSADGHLKEIVDNLPVLLRGVTPPAISIGGPLAEIRVPLDQAVGPHGPLFLHPGLTYNDPSNAAANLAGGTGTMGQGSDIFGDDDREISGTVVIDADAIDSSSGAVSGEVRWQPHIHVKDTVDFCPGNLGNPIQRLVTLPMSKLEAMKLTRDVPVTIDYDLDLRHSRFQAVPLIGPLPPSP